MFHLPSFIKAFFVLLIIVAVLLVVTNFSNPIQKQAESVLGVQLQPNQSEALPEKLQKDLNNSIQDAKAKGLETSVEDVLSFGARAQKIINDYQNVQEDVQKRVDEFFKEQEQKKEEN